jgi:hypothetical protein
LIFLASKKDYIFCTFTTFEQAGFMIDWKAISAFLLAISLSVCVSITAFAQGGKAPARKDRPPAPAEDISGMYSFLREGEFVQINVDEGGVSGYISRFGDLESDHGAVLDQFFSKASVQGHDVTFTTKQIHGVWFEFKGRFDRGPARTRTEDGYYVLRGTLTEFSTTTGKDVTRRSRAVDFKLLGQPTDDDLKPSQPKK